MSKIDKLLDKFYSKPIPSDITFDEVERIMKYFGCKIEYGKHPKVVYPKYNRVIPVPKHGKTVDEAYIKQLKDLLDMIKED